MELDRDICYRALSTRDARFDGRFYTAVTTTGIYCRPICPARTPKPEHCIFLPSAAAAHEIGYRPCLRCRPEIAPGVAGWRGTESTVSRALRLIADGALDESGDVESLAARLGIGARHLRRLFDRHLGASPVAVAQANRLLFAKRLIDETPMSMTEIAFASGFGSIRRFNDVMRRAYGRAPGELRGAAGRRVPEPTSGLTLKLPFSSPYDWRSMISFLGSRAIPGVESADAGCYSRTVAVDGSYGCVQVRPVAGESHLLATLRISAVSALPAIIGRLRGLFDLDADVTAIGAHLAGDPLLAPMIAERPGLRVPGAFDLFELTVRAILGQQVSVAAARTLAGRIVAAFGERLPDEMAGGCEGLSSLFPTPERLADADLSSIGLTRSRAATVTALAAKLASEPEFVTRYMPAEEAIDRLVSLPGIGRWTAEYVAMRGLRAPDAFPEGDLGLLRALAGPDGRPSPAELHRIAERWRPWRAYAALHLWTSESTPAAAGRE